MHEGLLLLVLVPLAGAPACYAIHKKNRTAGDLFSIFICAAVLALSIALSVHVAQGAAYAVTLHTFGNLGFSLKMDGFRAIYVTITTFTWLIATLFGREYFAFGKNVGRFQLFSLLTLSATIGVFLSADLFTTFLFFEWVSLCSFALVGHDETPKAMQAAGTYLTIAVMGGLAMLMGLFLLFEMTGTLDISKLAAACAAVQNRPRLYVASALLLIGFGAKAGIFPLHIWLPQAHPAAPAPASALLSGILTKTGVFGVLLVSCELLSGSIGLGFVLLALGTVTMLHGAVLALLSNDLKRTLACSSISQIGFIVVGAAARNLLGDYNALAVRGILLHMVNHSLAKMVLFTVAGIVYINLHKLSLDDIRGWGRGKLLLAFAFLMGALSAAGVPLWGGYVSKTLLHESLVECIHLFEGLPAYGFLQLAEGLFLLAGGLTVAYMAKLFITIFVEKPTHAFPQKKRYMSRLTTIILIGCSLVFPMLGMLPHRLSETLAAFGEGFMRGHAPKHEVYYFAWVNLKGAVISLAAGACIYAAMRYMPIMKRVDSSRFKRWDLETLFYRPLLQELYRLCALFFTGVTGAPGQSGQPVSKFYEKYYWLFYPVKNVSAGKRAISGSFSFGLLILGVGLCAALAWMLRVHTGG